MIKPPLPAQTGDTIFLYDGCLEGLLCCVYRAIRQRTDPFDIVAFDEVEPSLYALEEIATDLAAADRVAEAITSQISLEAMDLVTTVFLSCLAHREMAILRFLRLGFTNGPSTVTLLQHPDVATLFNAERHLQRERHLLTGFLRFADYDGKLISVISPKNQVLPFLASHFIDRYRCEEFLIYDKTHHSALVYQKGQAHILPMEDLILPETQPHEQTY